LSQLKRFQIHHFRNLARVDLALEPGLNLIVGDNAAGKTAIIEALWVLASGRSFRTAQPKQLIQHDHDAFTLFAEVQQGEALHRLGIQRQPHQIQLKLNGETVRGQTALAQHLPVQMLTPESHRLLEEGPKARRQFMDWGCFYQTPGFLPLWRTYQRALKQRNQALKQNLPDAQITLWDTHLVQTALQIDELRQRYLEDLTPYLQTYCTALMPELTTEVQLSYRAGWPQQTEDLLALLKQHLPQDRQSGHTQYGCHRADIRFRFGKLEALQTLSRGQQKLFVCALLLAQAQLHYVQTGHHVIMLIDDLPAELDANHRQTLLELLQQLKLQHLITTTDINLIPHSENSPAWHLSNGKVL
jgi:DNA replication and repair protein RecF